MSDAIDTVANAFAVDMGGKIPASDGGGAKETKARPEVIMNEPGFLENPEDRAGGDDLPPPKPKKAKESLDQLLENGGPDEDEDEDQPEEQDDDADDEGDDETKKDDDGDNEESDEEREFFDKPVEVMIDGEPAEVTVREALDGYIRNKTFQQRLNQVNEVAQAVKANGMEVVQARQKYITMLQEAAEIAEQVIPPEPDWDKLFSENPAQARNIQKNYEAFTKTVEEIKQKRQKAIVEAQQESARETAKFAQEEAPKFAVLAKWRTPEDRAKDLKSMHRTGLAAGFTADDLSQVYDSRMLNILLKASKYDRMMAARPKSVKTVKTPTERPGAGKQTPRSAPKASNRASAQLSRTGNVEDAIPVFAQLLSRSKR